MTFLVKKWRWVRAIAVSILGLVLGISPAALGQSTLVTIHTFSGPDGSYSYAPLVRDGAGNLYGTTASGGGFNAGTVFRVDPAGNESVLYSFKGRKDGGNPHSGLLIDPKGNLYGITAGGGTGFDQGVIFEVTPSGREIVLHALTTSEGSGSASGLLRDPAGNLYGTTETGRRSRSRRRIQA